MLSKTLNLIDEIKSDFVSSWNLANILLKNPPIDKRILAASIFVVFTVPVFVNYDPNILIPLYLNIIFVTIVTFIFLTWSNTFWFLFKKMWMYKIHVKMRKSINYYVKNINKLKIDDEDADNPEEAIYVISQYNSTGINYHIVRNGIEVALLLVILLVTLPYFFLFNLALFFMQFFYVMIFDNQSSSQVFSDLKTLVFCVHKLYKDSPENCKKLIYENTMESVRDLGAIYRAIDMASK